MNVLDLCSGIGGFSLGLERAGARTVGFCEISEQCRAILARNWPDVRSFCDIRSLDAKQVASLGAIDTIAAGFPCQNISLAGDGAGLSGDRSILFWEVIRAVRVVRPRVVLLENVEALLGRGMGDVLGALAREGYDAEWDCIRAFDVGRPHIRKRVFIVAYAAGDRWGPGRPGGLADGITWLPVVPCWSGDPVASFEEGFAQPALLGMDDGIPGGLHRLGPCGNAILPQISEAIGRSIMSAPLSSQQGKSP
jgi:DNA (cytosine-5)-methyltransferase 1